MIKLTGVSSVCRIAPLVVAAIGLFTGCASAPPPPVVLAEKNLEVFPLTDVSPRAQSWWSGLSDPTLDAWVSEALHPSVGETAWAARKSFIDELPNPAGPSGETPRKWSEWAKSSSDLEKRVEAFRMDLAAEVVSQYALFKDAHQRMVSLERSLTLNHELAYMASRAFDAGMLSESAQKELSQQQILIKKELENARIERDMSLEKLAVLAGRDQPPALSAAMFPEWQFPHRIALEADWLKTRPDVIEAETEVIRSFNEAGVPLPVLVQKLGISGRLVLENNEVVLKKDSEEALSTLGLTFPFSSWLAGLGSFDEFHSAAPKGPEEGPSGAAAEKASGGVPAHSPATSDEKTVEAISAGKRLSSIVSQAWESSLSALERLGEAGATLSAARRSLEIAEANEELAAAKMATGRESRSGQLKAELAKELAYRNYSAASRNWVLAWVLFQQEVFGKGYPYGLSEDLAPVEPSLTKPR